MKKETQNKIENTGDYASYIIENYDELTEEERNQIFSIAENPETALIVSEIMEYKYYSLPADYRNKIFAAIPPGEKTAKSISRLIYEFFDKLPEEIRNKRLVEIYDYPGGNFYKYKILKFHFLKLPEGMRENLLLKTSVKPNVARFIPKFLFQYIKNVSPETLGKLFVELIENHYGLRLTANLVRDYFYLIAEPYRAQVIFKLMENPERLSRAAYITGKYFDKIPEKQAYEIINRLYREEKGTWGIVGLLVNFFDKVEAGIRNELLLTISKIERSKKSAEFVTREHAEKIPPEILAELEKNLNIILKKEDE